MTSEEARILDFDIENRPLSYWFDGQCTAEVTAIAASFIGEKEVISWCLGEDEPEDILMGFQCLYQEADIVTGHYIRRHDLRIINASLMEYRLPPLQPKLAHDTKLDLMKTGGMSASQESLSAMFELSHPKHHMTQKAWRDANRLTPEGIALTRKRVTYDVIQHKELYQEIKPYLHPPKEWKP